MKARIRRANAHPERPQASYVLYWMTAYRRSGWNFALERAVQWARELGRPLVILEALRCDYPWASARLHRFILEGTRDNAAAFAAKPVFHYPYVEPRPGAGKGLLAALARDACAVVGDDFPGFRLPRMGEAAARQLDCRFELVDSNGLLPLQAAPRVFARAVDFRRFLQKELFPYLSILPAADPLHGLVLPLLTNQALRSVLTRWPMAPDPLAGLASLPIDHGVPPAAMQGGHLAGTRRLDAFLQDRLARYAEDRGDPDLEGTSALSPYLHFGHVGVHQILASLAEKEAWREEKISAKANGRKAGWWGMSAAAEAFLDELVTWRELSFNFCSKRPADCDRYEALPGWARATLEAHLGDAREHLYTPAQLEAAATHDELWNAAQRQLVRDGWFHGTLRMLWGKKILEWSRHPREALQAMARLMDKYALDGRDPCSYAGTAWVLGRYDRPWGPERPVFGVVRYMSSQNTARKRAVRSFLRRYAAVPP